MIVRLIPRLDVKGPNLVKGIHLEGLRVLGAPQAFARHYYETGADELLFMDAVASLYQRNSLLEMVAATARTIFIPLTVGGGIRSVADIREALCAGADKVALNTAALRRPELLREAARRFGSSTIVLSIEAIRQPDGSYHCYTDCGREETGVEVVNWAIRATELGVGEVLVTSVDREGTGKGFDLELTRQITSAVPIPVIACGGAGTLEHIDEAIQAGGVDGVCLASMLHYDFVKQGQDAPAHREGNREFLARGQAFSRVQSASLPEIKEHLCQKGVPCRHALAAQR
jgi:cyclase